MKRIVCLLLVVFGSLLANPIDPSFLFSELKFDEQNNWQLEIHSLWSDIISQVDSVVISSSAGKSKVRNSVFTTGITYFYAINNDLESLEKALIFNRDKDTIGISTYFKNRQVGYNELIIGEGSAFPTLRTDRSIADYFYSSFSGQMHNLGTGYNPTPSIGEANDSTGVMGALNGKIMDKNGNLIKNKSYIFTDVWPLFVTSDNFGNYHLRTLAREFNVNFLYGDYNYNYLVSPVKVRVQFDSTSHCDFILDMVDINEQPSAVKSSTLLYNYPNPFNNQTAIYYEVPEGLKYKNATIRISNIKGEAVAVLAANQKSGSVYWNADHNSAGMYIYQLLIDGKAVKSGEMVLLK